MRLAAAKTSKVRYSEVRVAVLPARCRVPRLRLRVSTCAGTGARKYLRRALGSGGKVMSLMVGTCGAGLPTEEEHTGMHGKRFVWGPMCPRAYQCGGGECSSVPKGAEVKPADAGQTVGSGSHSLIRSDPGRAYIAPCASEEAIVFHEK